jgi:hydrogenase 3 maturation protease
MPPLKKTLSRWLDGASRVAVLGVGSDIRADDAAGLLIVKLLQESLSSLPNDRFTAFDGGAAPENLTGVIAKFKPSHIILVDAADFGARPGAVRIIAKDQIGGVSFSTHRMPLYILTEYMECTMNCRTMVIGIQTKTIEVMGEMSGEVEKNTQRLGLLIAGAVREVVCE